MYTKRELILDGYAEIGLAAYAFDIEPEEVQLALRQLDRMMAEWEPKLKLGYAMPATPKDSDPDQASGIPDFANSAVAMNLGMRLSKTFGKAIPPGLPQMAKNAYTELLAKTVQAIPMQYVGQLPKGAGNRRWGVDRQPYFRPIDDPLPTAPGGNLEFLEP